MASVLLREWVLGGMKGRLRRRHRKNQPALADIDRAKFENVAKEGAICFRIFAVKKNVRSDDHAGEYTLVFPGLCLTDEARRFYNESLDVTLLGLVASIREIPAPGRWCRFADPPKFSRQVAV